MNWEQLIALLRAYGADDAVIANVERLAQASVPTPEDPENATAADRLLVFPDGVDPLTDEELEAVEVALRGLADDESAPLELLNAAADALDVVNAENEARDGAAEEARAEREAVLARIRANGDGEGDSEDGDGDEDGGDPDADPEVDPNADPATASDDGDEDNDAATDDDREPVLASGRRVPLDHLRHRTPRRAAAREPEGTDDAAAQPTFSPITFAHGVPDVQPGARARNLSDIDRALERRRDSFRRSRPSRDGTVEWLPVASIAGRFPENRRLSDRDGEMLQASTITQRISEALAEGIRAARQHGGMVAAGGLCTLPTPIYNVPNYGTGRRPIRDQALVSFQASRGGVTDLTPPVLPDVAGAASQWTVANDAAAGDGDPVKPCLRVECGAQRTTQIYAVPLCLTVGNFMARTYPELQNAWSNLALVAHARFAEALLFARLVALSTATTNGTTDWSATIDLLATLDQAATGMRSRHRLDADFPFIVVLPETLLAVLRADVSRRMPGGGGLDENMALTDAQVLGWFRARSITPVWSPDVNVIGAQGAGALAHLPPTISFVMYPAGTFIHLDGGELDLGVVRDTTTNASNDFQIFSESFENVHMVGVESITGTIDVCPSGAVSGTIDPAAFCASYT